MTEPPAQETIARQHNPLLDALSEVIGEQIDPASTKVSLARPDKGSRSAAAHLLLCRIGNDRVVGLKRCYDNPEFIRRELVVAEAKKLVSLPRYGVNALCGIKLDGTSGVANWELAAGWEDKMVLLIDYGKYGYAKNFVELNPAEIKDAKNFCRQYGGWAAFNFLLGVNDRNEGNFVLFTDSQTLHSVDNEDGPYDSNGNEASPMAIIDAMRQHFQKLTVAAAKAECAEAGKTGFMETWKEISNAVGSLAFLEGRELSLTRARLGLNPADVIALFFP